MSSNGCKVLVVDDDADNRDLVSHLLHREGYLTALASNGAEAIELLHGGLDPDLILTDLVMPLMSGWELCQSVKTTPAWRSIPILVLCQMSASQRGKLQVDGAFEKPLDARSLLARIAELCGV